MKKEIVIYFLLFVSVNIGYSQTEYKNKANEKVILITDRDLYLTGEKILLKTFIFSANFEKNSNLSKIVYHYCPIKV